MCRADALRHKRRAADFHIWRGLQGRMYTQIEVQGKGEYGEHIYRNKKKNTKKTAADPEGKTGADRQWKA